jgi:hypothetical protein
MYHLIVQYIYVNVMIEFSFACTAVLCIDVYILNCLLVVLVVLYTYTATGKRYCMNAASMAFIPKGEPIPAAK